MDQEGDIKFKGKWYSRGHFENSNNVMWCPQSGGKPVAQGHLEWEKTGKGTYIHKAHFVKGNKKLFQKLEYLFAQTYDPDQKVNKTSSKGKAEAETANEENDTNETEATPRKASDNAAVFESTDPRYCLKLFLTSSKKYPGHAGLHVYLNPSRAHRFYTVKKSILLREMRKLIEQIRSLPK